MLALKVILRKCVPYVKMYTEKDDMLLNSQ